MICTYHTDNIPLSSPIVKQKTPTSTCLDAKTAVGSSISATRSMAPRMSREASNTVELLTDQCENDMITMEVSMLKSINIQFPEEIVELFGEKELEASLKKWAVLELVRAGKLSSGKAAEILGMTRWEFMDLMSSYEIPIANFPEEELDRQVKEKAGK